MCCHCITDKVAAKMFMLAGNATITLVSKKTGCRFTYKIQAPPEESKGPVTHFVKLMNGSDNETSFQYLGHITTNGYTHGRKSKVTAEAPSARAFDWFFHQLVNNDQLPETVELWHEGRCGRCGRKLTVPESIERGIGPECWGRM